MSSSDEEIAQVDSPKVLGDVPHLDQSVGRHDAGRACTASDTSTHEEAVSKAIDAGGPSGGGNPEEFRRPTSVLTETLCEIFRNKLGNEEEFQTILSLFRDELKSNLTEENFSEIRSAISSVKSNFFTRYRKQNRTWEKVKQKYQTFLSSKFVLPAVLFREKEQDSLELTPPCGNVSSEEPPAKRKPQWQDYSERHRRRLRAEISDKLSDMHPVAIVETVSKIATEEGLTDLGKVLKMASLSPLRPGKMLQSLEKEQVQVRNLTAQEALALILDKGLTKDTYMYIRELAISSGLKNYYPSYHRIVEAKMQCRPEEPKIMETCAEVSLQSLLNHTAKRIVELQQEVICTYSNVTELDTVSATFFLSWGFDGSTGQSIYKQKFASDEDDHSLFATTVIPLRMECNGNILWQNKTPQSPRFCRPLRLHFIKETKDVILREKHQVDQEIALLSPIEIKLSNERNVKITFKLFLTVIDGKVSSIISGATSQQTCGICRSTPKEFNDISKMLTKPIQHEHLMYGISPLHLWIRSLEFCLHLGYKNAEGLKTWRGNKESPIYKQRVSEIRKLLKDEFSLIVDQPRAGGSGSSNDGNTARRAFSDSNRKRFAEILGLESWLLDGLHTILCAIDSCLPLDPDKFGDFCLELARKYENTYKWYYMPVTIHRLFMHGKTIIQASALPLGMLSEQAGESANKLYRRYREMNARKFSREKTLYDVFQRCMDSSDPIMCQYKLDRRIKKAKKFPLPQSAMALIKPPESHFAARQVFEEIDDESLDDTQPHPDQNISLEVEENSENFV